MQRRDFIKLGISTVICRFMGENPNMDKQNQTTTQINTSNTFTLWQLPSQRTFPSELGPRHNQMNSYVIQTINGKVIVIDGGFKEDANYLKGFLGALGNHVDMWFISHQHIDHIGALSSILVDSDDLQIGKLYGSILKEEWIERHEKNSLGTARELNIAIKTANKKVDKLLLGQKINIDGIVIEILGIKNEEITTNAINNSSIVLKIYDTKKSILLTNDLGIQGGQKLINSPYRSKLKSDYVQMAHHGQGGVDEEFYNIANPQYCIWPTPLWLWNNDNGNGKGSGTWKTQVVYNWMKKLNIKKHYFLFEGLHKIN